MISHIVFAFSVSAAYLLGAFPTSYIMARAMKGIDIRSVGSGNAGATNVLRSIGRLPAIITLVVDILKGVLVVTILAEWSYPRIDYLDYDFYRGLLGITVISGHIWSVFLKFKGGKGVATTLGVSAILAPIALGSSLLVWAAAFYLTKYVSVASIGLLVAFPILAIVFGYPFYTVLFSVAVCGIGVYKHRENIRRLINRTESHIRL